MASLDPQALLKALADVCPRLQESTTTAEIDRVALEAEEIIACASTQIAKESASVLFAVVHHLALENMQLRAHEDAAITARESLFSGVAHDLRNPLNTFAMSAGLLRDDFERNEVDVNRALDLTTRLDRATGRMRGLVEDLLEASRITAGNVELQRKPEAAMSLVTHAVVAANARDERKLVTAARPLDDGAIVFVDRAKMLVVLAKVLAFAVKVTGEGGRVRLSMACARDKVVFAVRAPVPRGAPKPIVEGGRGGLALFVARGLVELHGGVFRARARKTLVVTMIFPAANPPNTMR
ncbi:MAG: hypothetical protein FWD69_07845 [Polyangiaceae bacterium]|nr:hypothetical protein [Polyangiaceae bacterium]